MHVTAPHGGRASLADDRIATTRERLRSLLKSALVLTTRSAQRQSKPLVHPIRGSEL
jgi:hypothetical protein